MALTLYLNDEEENNVNNLIPNDPMMSVFMGPEINHQSIQALGFFIYSSVVKARKAKNEAVTVDSLFIDKNVEKRKLDLQPLLFDKFFNKGEVIVLAAKAGVGKSWLSIEIAKNPKIRKALFITIEDYNEWQVPRYIKSLSEENKDFEIIGYKNWYRYYNGIMTSMKEKIDFRALIESQAPVPFSKFLSRKNELQKQLGIKQEQGLDNILVFEKIMEDIESEGFDFVCIDSLNALLGHPSKITRRVLERIIAKTTKIGATLLIIHHINKKGEVIGTSDLVNTVDSVYVLSVSEDDKNVLILDEIKARNKPEGGQTVTLKRESKGDFIVSFEPLENEKAYVPKRPDWYKNLSESEKRIVSAFAEQEENVITKEDLEEYLNEGVPLSSIDNHLLKLEQKGIIKAAKPKREKGRWDTIELLKNIDDADL